MNCERVTLSRSYIINEAFEPRHQYYGDSIDERLDGIWKLHTFISLKNIEPSDSNKHVFLLVIFLIELF